MSFEEFENGSFLLNQDTIYSYKKISKVSYLEYINKDKKKIFITFTLPNKLFHKYNYEGKKTATYKSADLFEENIIRGLEYINKQIHHYFYKTLKFKIDRFCKKNKIKNKEIKRIDFIKIIEPHRSLDAHLHSLFYVDNLFLDIIEEVYNMTIDYFDLKQTKIDKDIEKGSSYLTKYLLKTTKGENLLYNHYKRYFSQFRFFSSSNFKHTTQEKIDLVYKYLYNNKKGLLDRYKRSKKPLYYLIEKLILKKIFTFEEEEKTSFNINYTKIKKEYNKVIKRYKIDKFLEKKKTIKKDIIKDKKLDFEIDISVDNIEDLYFTLEHITKKANATTEENYIKRFKQKIIINLNEYLTITHKKVVSKMYYKNIQVLDKKEFEYQKLTNEDIRKLLLNPFEE